MGNKFYFVRVRSRNFRACALSKVTQSHGFRIFMPHRIASNQSTNTNTNTNFILLSNRILRYIEEIQ